MTSRDLRLDAATVGGLPRAITVAELRTLCRNARVDSVGVGGTVSAALTVTVPGATLSAVQSKYDAYGDSLHPVEAPDLWIAIGDSARFADGKLIPRTVGGFRKLDSLAFVVIDHGDDGTGSYIVRCQYPFLRAVVDNVWPLFAAAGVVPLMKASPSDTTRIWRIETDADPPDARVVATCARARVT